MVANLYPAPDGQVSDIDSLVQVLSQWKRQNPQVIQTMGGWILGNGYDDAQLSEQRHPTATDLDRVSKDQPVMILHQSGHLASVNHKALALLNINQNTENPAGELFVEKQIRMFLMGCWKSPHYLLRLVQYSKMCHRK